MTGTFIQETKREIGEVLVEIIKLSLEFPEDKQLRILVHLKKCLLLQEDFVREQVVELRRSV